MQDHSLVHCENILGATRCELMYSGRHVFSRPVSCMDRSLLLRNGRGAGKCVCARPAPAQPGQSVEEPAGPYSITWCDCDAALTSHLDFGEPLP